VQFIRDYFKSLKSSQSIDSASLQRALFQSMTYTAKSGDLDVKKSIKEITQHAGELPYIERTMLFAPERKAFEESLEKLHLHASKLAEPYKSKALTLVANLQTAYNGYFGSRFQPKDFDDFLVKANQYMYEAKNVFITKRSGIQASNRITQEVLKAVSRFKVRKQDPSYNPDWRFFRTETGKHAMNVHEKILKMKPGSKPKP
jgi:hypothetical protein